MPSDDLFTERLRGVVVTRGLTPKDVTVLTDIDQRTISRYLAGTNTPGTENLRKLARGLELSADYLIGLEPARPPSAEGTPAARAAAAAAIAEGDLAGHPPDAPATPQPRRQRRAAPRTRGA